MCFKIRAFSGKSGKGAKMLAIEKMFDYNGSTTVRRA
jgi:hypothetical protein